jgi:acetyl esterase
MTAGTKLRTRNLLFSYVPKRFLSPRVELRSAAYTDVPVREPRVVKVPTRHGLVRCYIYDAHPGAPLAVDGTPPVHVNIHGGAFILTNPRQDDHLCQFIAAEVGATVVNIDYSTAPEVRFPVAEEQCYDVLKWVSGSGPEMGWDSSRISLSGGSAGAKLVFSALHLAHQASQPSVRAAVSIVPVVDLTLAPETYTSTLNKPLVSPWLIRLMQETYFVEAERWKEPLASPAFDEQLAQYTPPLLIIGGGFDSLTPQIDRFVEQLKAQGAPVTYRSFDDHDHNFVEAESTADDVIAEYLDLVRAHLLDHLR